MVCRVSCIYNSYRDMSIFYKPWRPLLRRFGWFGSTERLMMPNVISDCFIYLPTIGSLPLYSPPNCSGFAGLSKFGSRSHQTYRTWTWPVHGRSASKAPYVHPRSYSFSSCCTSSRSERALVYRLPMTDITGNETNLFHDQISVSRVTS